ncbi:MAG: VF530 family DNA-binding protein [Nannocystales bacterium]
MEREHPNDPLHGVTLKTLLEKLVARHGWPGLAARVEIRCFSSNPSIKSSLIFLRRNRWARDLVEQLYLEDISKPAEA